VVAVDKAGVEIGVVAEGDAEVGIEGVTRGVDIVSILLAQILEWTACNFYGSVISIELYRKLQNFSLVRKVAIL
jgi:hypothetical protein